MKEMLQTLSLDPTGRPAPAMLTKRSRQEAWSVQVVITASQRTKPCHISQNPDLCRLDNPHNLKAPVLALHDPLPVQPPINSQPNPTCPTKPSYSTTAMGPALCKHDLAPPFAKIARGACLPKKCCLSKRSGQQGTCRSSAAWSTLVKPGQMHTNLYTHKPPWKSSFPASCM